MNGFHIDMYMCLSHWCRRRVDRHVSHGGQCGELSSAFLDARLTHTLTYAFTAHLLCVTKRRREKRNGRGGPNNTHTESVKGQNRDARFVFFHVIILFCKTWIQYTMSS